MTNPILKSEKSLRGLKNSFITRLNFLEQINALIKFNDSIHFDLLTVSEPKIRAHYFSFKFLSQYFRVSWELSKSKHSKQQSKSLKRNLVKSWCAKKSKNSAKGEEKTKSGQCEKNNRRFVTCTCIQFLRKVRSDLEKCWWKLSFVEIFFSLRLFSFKLKIDSNSKSIWIALPKFDTV